MKESHLLKYAQFFFIAFLSVYYIIVFFFIFSLFHAKNMQITFGKTSV